MNLAPAPVQTYRLVSPAIRGLTLGFVGSPLAPWGMFDVVAAIELAGDPDRSLSVCDNAIKQALDACPHVERIA